MLRLAEQEKNSIELYLLGYKINQIAQFLFVTPKTAEGYFNRAKKKLNCQSDYALKSAYERYKSGQKTIG
jgi:DNA-binding CsgD family transcriptional regulator